MVQRSVPLALSGIILTACGQPVPDTGLVARAVSHGTYTASVEFAGNDCGRCGKNSSTCLNNVATFNFADPLPPGWTAREVLVKVYGNDCDATQLDVAIDGTALPTSAPAQGACACMGCDLLGLADYAVAPPGRFPGWLAGGMNTITLNPNNAKLCAAYATIDVTGDLGLSVAPTSLALVGPVNMVTPSQSVTMANTAGMDALLVSNINLGGPDPNFFQVTSAVNPPFSIAVGGKSNIDVSCTPDNNGERTAFLFINTTPTGKVVIGLSCDVFVPRAIGDPCTKAADCTSGFCADGLCCDSACTDQCATCAAPQMKGRCMPNSGKPAGGRPACTGAPACAQCDGIKTATCAYPNNTTCRLASCTAGVATAASTCDGKGGCVAGMTANCDYGCAGTACAQRPLDMAPPDLGNHDLRGPTAHDKAGGCAIGRRPTNGAALWLALWLLVSIRARRSARLPAA